MLFAILLAGGRVGLHQSLRVQATPNQESDENEYEGTDEDHSQHLVLKDNVIASKHF